MRVSLRPLLAASAFAVFGAAALHAQSKGGGGEPVAIDFYITGADGPVFNLRADEVEIKVDGRTRQIRTLRYVSLPNADPSGVPLEPAEDLEPPYGSNVPDDEGRWVTIVADDESIPPGAERNAMNAAVRLVNSLGLRDRVSYVTMPNGGLEVEFTTDHEKVRSALRKFVGRAPRESTEQDRSCRSRLVLNGMRDLLEGLAGVRGPKTIVLISSGILNPRRDAPADRPPGPCEIRPVYFQEVASAATLAHAHLFVVQPDDLRVESARNAFTDASLSRFSAADAERAGLESLAGVTGGDFHRIVGPDDNVLATSVQGMGGYYVATFEPERGERNGFMHRLEIVVARPRVKVRARPDVVIPKPTPRSASTATPVEMLRQGALYLGLPLRTVAITSAGSAGNGGVQVMALLEPAERGVTLTSAVIGLIDSRDRLVAQWTAEPRELAGAMVTAALPAFPGPYRLRVAATDSAGRRGTAEYDFSARLTEADPLSMSGLVLGTAQDGAFTPKLVFGDEPSAVVYFEVYGTPPSADAMTVRLEVAHAPDGGALATGSAPRITTATPDRRLVLGAVPIGFLPQGDYVIRAIVSIGGRPVGRVTRTLRKAPSLQTR